jgi:hypothetical protein
MPMKKRLWIEAATSTKNDEDIVTVNKAKRIREQERSNENLTQVNGRGSAL